jgi:hypothetical protein
MISICACQPCAAPSSNGRESADAKFRPMQTILEAFLIEAIEVILGHNGVLKAGTEGKVASCLSSKLGEDGRVSRG